jgi:hypothetical protein
VRFDTITYGHAVRTHFWGSFPDLREDLRTWMDHTLSSSSVPSQDRVEALLRYTTQCLHTGHPDDLCHLAETWAERAPARFGSTLDATGTALTHGLQDDRYGQFFRRQIYQWSVTPTLWPALAILLVALCEGVIAPAHPQQALVRLRHFTRHRYTNVVDEARRTLVRLADDNRFARRLLERVHEDLTGHRPYQVDYALFQDLVTPERLLRTGEYSVALIANSHVRELITDGWRKWLERHPHDHCATAIKPWLDAYTADPAHEQLLDILATSALGNPRLAATLYAVARDWVALATDTSTRRARLRTAALIKHKSTTNRPLTPVSEGIAR